MQITKLQIAAVPVGLNNAFPHGLVRVPNLIVLSANETGANVTPSAVAFDATNIYLDNGGAAPEPAAVLVMALHSIIQ